MCYLNTIYCITDGWGEWHLYWAACLNVEVIIACQLLFMSGKKGQWHFVELLIGALWRCPLFNHIQAKESEGGCWSCENSRVGMSATHPLLLKWDSQLQTQHRRCFPTFCTSSLEKRGQVSLKGETNSLTAFYKDETHSNSKGNPWWWWCTSPIIFYFFAKKSTDVHNVMQLRKWSLLLETADYFKGNIWISHWWAVIATGNQRSHGPFHCLCWDHNSLCFSPIGRKRWGQRSAW